MQQLIRIDGAPCATKAARTVRRGGKSVLTTISGDMAKAADYLSQCGLEQGIAEQGAKDCYPLLL